MAGRWFRYGCIVISFAAFLLVPPSQSQAQPSIQISAVKSTTDNYFYGSMVVEVVVTDPAKQSTSSQTTPPVVNINGKLLQMNQAVDGDWYGYFADRNFTRNTDQIALDSGVSGRGLDAGVFLSNTTPNSVFGLVDTDPGFQQTGGVAVPTSDGLMNFTNGTASFQTGSGTANSFENLNNHLRNPPAINTNPNVLTGQTGLDTNLWPIVQLFPLNPTGNVIVQYFPDETNVQTTTLTYDIIGQYSDFYINKFEYAPGDDVLMQLTDPRLNFDPTSRDSWTFNMTGPVSAFYQAFNADGSNDTNGTAALINLIPHMDDNSGLGLDDNAELTFLDTTNRVINPDGIEFVANDLQPTTSITDGTTVYDSLITFVETAPNSGVFVNYDENGRSTIRISHDAQEGFLAWLDYERRGRVAINVVVPEPASAAVLALTLLPFVSRHRRAA